MPFLSVIIPVYRVEKYLGQCIDSVLRQNLESFELILVDDGSPDRCPQICDEYAARNPQIQVIHKPNGGSSSARNAGIHAATGRYIMFLDSDDWWNPEVSVQSMLRHVSEQPDVDMFLFSSLDYVEGKGYLKRKEHELLDQVRTDTVAHYYEDLLAHGNLEVSAATKIIKADLLRDRALQFKEGIVSEDVEWMLRLLRRLQRVSILNEPLYLCRMGRQDSITNTIGQRNIRDLLNIVLDSIRYYEDDRNSKTYLSYEYCYCAYLWFCALGLSGTLTKEAFQTLKPMFQETAFVCRYSNSKKTRAAYFAYRILGLQGARRVLNSYLYLKGRFHLNKKKVEA